MRWLMVVAAIALAGPAVGQAVVDDSSADIPTGRLAAAVKRIQQQLNDPQSLQLRSVRYDAAKDRVCGMYNAKNHLGGYGEFSPFADTPGKTVIAPASSAPGRAASMEEIVAICVRS